jgi:hypothetical protein
MRRVCEGETRARVATETTRGTNVSVNTCPHCGGSLTARPATLADVLGPERMRELVEEERQSAARIAARRQAQRARRRPRRI